MRFKYKAKKDLNEIVEGLIEAPDNNAALNKLIEQSLYPIEIIPESAALPEKKPVEAKKIFLTGLFGNRISKKDVIIFTRKLATLTRSKVELMAALKVVAGQTENPGLRDVILNLQEIVSEGLTFSDAVSRHPQVFPAIFVNIVRAGEAGGKLDTALEQISGYLGRQEAIRSKVTAALAYPIVLLSMGLASIFIIITFVMPRLKPLFANIHKDLPFITKIILDLSDVSAKTWIFVFLALIAGIIFLYMRRGSDFFKDAGQKLKTKLPVIKRIVKNQELAQFALSLGLLIKNNVGALKALNVAALAVEDVSLRGQLKEVSSHIGAGRSIAKSLESLTALPDFFVKMVAVGEESGRLADVLYEVSDSYSQEVESDIVILGSLIEPVMIIIIGGILGTIVISILVPMFDVTQMVK
jgi:type II secretory pathway component PulF